MCSDFGKIGFLESLKRLTWRAFEFQTDRGQERGRRRTLDSVYSVLKGHSEMYVARTQMLHLDELKKN